MAKTLDLSADIGEGYGVYPAPMQPWRAKMQRGGEIVPSVVDFPSPRRIMNLVSSVSLACGFHGGDPLLIKEYIEVAAQTGCGVGAHPSFPDRAGFGNRYMEIPGRELKAIIQYQLGAVAGFLAIRRLPLHHVKCHGALYNHSMVDEALAQIVAEAVGEYDASLPLYGLTDSALEHVTGRLGLPFWREGFADRAYHEGGSLVDRKRDDAMVLDPHQVAERVTRMVKEGVVWSVEGAEVHVIPKTICFHPDTPGMIQMLEKARRLLTERGVMVDKETHGT
jgi:5-oxoprolinase (ATP-hydrolysing) subunit A